MLNVILFGTIEQDSVSSPGSDLNASQKLCRAGTSSEICSIFQGRHFVSNISGDMRA